MANTKVTSAVIADNAVGIDQLNVSDGTNGQVLTTNGSGTLSFSTISGYTDSDVETYLDSGTSTPTFGAMNTNGAITLGNASYWIGNATNGYRFNNSSDTLNLLVIKDNGNIGIGTSSPTGAKLHVVGAVKATDLIAHDTTGINLQTSNGTKRLVVDNSGNVGIGTTSPSSYYSGADNLVVSQSSGEGGITIVTANNTYGNLYFADGTAGADAYRGGIIYGHSANNMNFYTDGNERMRITSGGSILFGKTSASASVTGIHINNNGVQISVVDFTSAGTAKVFNNNNATGSTYKIEYRQNNSAVGNISVGSSSTSYNTTSDYRLKENVDYNFNALERVAQLKPARFNFIADADTTVDGFLAHEVQDIVPEAIHGVKDEMQEEEYEVTPAVLDEDGNVVTEAVMGTREVPVYQGIDQSKLVPLLTKAIQEQQTIIDDLKARIETLENA